MDAMPTRTSRGVGTLCHMKIVALTSSTTLFVCFLQELMILKGPVLAAIEIKTDLFAWPLEIYLKVLNMICTKILFRHCHTEIKAAFSLEQLHKPPTLLGE